MSVRAILRLALGLLLFSNPSLAFFDDYLPLSKAEIHKRISMQHLASLDPSKLVPSLKVGTHTVKFSMPSAEADLIISGETTQQGSWSVHLESVYALLATNVYQADLDENGQQDLILLKPTAGNGLAPSQHLLVLSFDQQGQVTPWQVEGYFANDKKGIVDFLDLNGNGRAELVFMSYGEGYWQTVLYEVNQGRWQKIQGKFAGKNYPLLTRFTFKPNHKIANPNHKALEPVSLATDKTVLTGHLKSYAWANVDQSEDLSLLLQTAQNLVKCQPVSWYGLFMLVLDKPKERQIISLSASSQVMQAALQVATEKPYPSSLYGQRSMEACSPEQLWIKLD